MMSPFFSNPVLFVSPVLVCAMPLSGAIAQSPPIEVTSIQQVKDVSQRDPYFEALRSLIEEYGLSFTYADGTFQGNRALTRAEFVVYLNQTIEEFNFTPTTHPYLSASSILQFRDVRPTDFYYDALQTLMENYGINFSHIQGEFRPKRAIAKGEAIRAFNQVFGYNGTTQNLLSLTRGEFVIELHQALREIELPIDNSEQQIIN